MGGALLARSNNNAPRLHALARKRLTSLRRPDAGVSASSKLVSKRASGRGIACSGATGAAAGAFAAACISHQLADGERNWRSALSLAAIERGKNTRMTYVKREPAAAQPRRRSGVLGGRKKCKCMSRAPPPPGPQSCCAPPPPGARPSSFSGLALLRAHCSSHHAPPHHSLQVALLPPPHMSTILTQPGARVEKSE